MHHNSRKFPFSAFLLWVPLTLSMGPSANGAESRPSEPERASTFSHALWDGLLKKHVNEAGRVDYDELRRKDSGTLRKYLGELARANLSRLRDERELKAFWTNAYNAICVQTLIDHDLPSSVPHSNVPLFGTNIFTERTYKVAGKVRSLDDIEHGILRKVYRDPRLHAALVCGARSCPRLRREAYTGAALDRQLEEECRSWVQTETSDGRQRKNRLDRKARVYNVSKIFDWFQEDFGGSENGVLEFVKRYSTTEDRKFLEDNRVRIEYLDYDWKLNAQP